MNMNTMTEQDVLVKLQYLGLPTHGSPAERLERLQRNTAPVPKKPLVKVVITEPLQNKILTPTAVLTESIETEEAEEAEEVQAVETVEAAEAAEVVEEVKHERRKRGRSAQK